MSEFSPTPEMSPASEPTPPQAPPVIRDTTTVRHFRTGSADVFLPRLNQDLELELTPEVFQRLQKHFTSTAFRDPTVGELRLLNTLARPSTPTPDSIVVGELTTSSPAIAETWADMMAKHGALHGAFGVFHSPKAPTPPCSLTDALSLTGRYLRRAENRKDDGILFLSSPRREAVAAAEGYSPVARVAVGEGVVSLWTRKLPAPEEIPSRAGDLILYLPRLKHHRVLALLSEDAKRSRPGIGAIRAIAEKSLLQTIMELCPAADLYVGRLTEGRSDPSRVPVEQICARPAVSPDGVCGYLLRVPVRHAQAINQTLDGLKIPSVVCGQVRNGGNFVFLVRDGEKQRDIPAATLPAELLGTLRESLRESHRESHLYAMNVEASSASAPTAVSPAMACLPSVIPAESGITPDGREIVALTLHDGKILEIPSAGALLSALSVEISHPHAAFVAASEATADLARIMEARGLTRDGIRLSVILHAANEAVLTDGGALGAICGIYCAAAQLALPVEEPTVEVIPSEIPLRLTVIALATAKPHGVGEEDRISRPDRQWHPTLEPASDGQSAYLLPVLRRSYEDSLKALSAALSSDRQTNCLIRPLAMNVSREETTGEPVYTLHPDSQSKLVEQLAESIIPVFSMNEGDTRILLAQPAVSEAIHRRLEAGGTILVLGDSCMAFAEHGLLPSALLQTRTLPFGGQRATVTYSHPTEPSTRYLRVDPLAPLDLAEAAGIPHILRIHLPDGTIIPDGFLGWSGQVLGLLNGVDTAILPRNPRITTQWAGTHGEWHFPSVRQHV